MSDDLREIKDQLKELSQTVGQMNSTLIRQEENIKHHIYRTDLAEENIKALWQFVSNNLKEIRGTIEPLKKHVAMAEGVLKFLGVVSVIVGIAAGIVKILIYCGFHLF